MNTLSEYDVCYATKEYLYKNGYLIVTWNPPGSQGTFTIPNPAKDPTYRGQTGSESPDLIAIKGNELLFVEAKDDCKKSLEDIEKLKNLLANPKRKDLLFKICQYQMSALGHDIDFNNLNPRYAVAVPYEANWMDTYTECRNITVYTVKSKINNWDNKVIDGALNVEDMYTVTENSL